jgi:hypothetical protein
MGSVIASDLDAEAGDGSGVVWPDTTAVDAAVTFIELTPGLLSID